MAAKLMGTVKTNDPFYVNRPREYSPAGGNCFYKSVLSEVIKESMYWI